MKPAILFILFSMCLPAYGQQMGIHGLLRNIGCSADSSVRACLQIDKNGYGKELLIYKTGKTWDTLYLHREDDSAIGDTCSIQTFQIDQVGLKEVVISWSGESSHSYGRSPGGGFHHKFTKHEIWNLNTGKKLFAAQSAFYNQESQEDYSERDSSHSGTRAETCSYQYNFSVTTDGKVIISKAKEKKSLVYDNATVNRKKEEKNACSFLKTDHKPGVYVFRNGQFTRE